MVLGNRDRNRRRVSFFCYLIRVAVLKNKGLIGLGWITSVDESSTRSEKLMGRVVAEEEGRGRYSEHSRVTGTDSGQSIYVNYAEKGINRRPAVHRRVTSERTIK